MWCHSCICLEEQRKFTEGTFQDKLPLIPDLNLGSFWYEAEMSRLSMNFLSTLDLFGFCAMLLTSDIYH
jgi:hypothetical protein